MWIMLTDVSGDKIAVNFNHVLSYNVYGTGTRLVTLSADLTFLCGNRPRKSRRGWVSK